MTLKRLFAVLLFLAASVLLVQLVGELNRVKTLKTDLAEIRHVRYGLLDADQWVERVAAIVERRVSAFELTDANRPQLVRAVEQVLDTLLVEIERYLRQRNLKGGGTWVDQLQGALQQGLQDVLIDFDKLREKVPRYAEAVVEQLGRPEAKEEIKGQILTLLRRTSDSTFAKVDRAPLQRLFEHHACIDAGHCAQRLQDQIDAAGTPTRQRLGILAGLVGLLFLLCLGGSSRRDGGGKARLEPFGLFLLTGATLILLLGGLLTPMIEIEARIGELTLIFLSEPIVFSDQVLYFQSKSLLEVVRILVMTGAADMWLVALLITLFSIIFPALKLIATYLYYYDLRRARDSAAIRFFALRSGKWSMADVLVIALFMAYIGFDGLVESQLASLWSDGAAAQARLGASVLTTNGTSLEPGFYLFLAFVLASLLLSARLEKAFAESHPN